MHVSRRDFLQASSAVAAALGLRALLGGREVLGAEGAPSVVWLQAQSCSGCSVSVLNSIYYKTADELLTQTLDVNYHPTLMAAAGSTASAAAEAARKKPGYVLVVEGAVPTAASGRYCYLWPGMTALRGIQNYSKNAGLVLAVGTCASFGGVAAAKPNPTGVRSLQTIVGSKPVINIPGCPVHPDWLVGTIAYFLAAGRAPKLDSLHRPVDYFGKTVHDLCPYVDEYNRYFARNVRHAKGRGCFACHSASDRHIGGPDALGDGGCLYALGCKGLVTGCDCPTRKWNSGSKSAYGVNWCVQAGGPCIGCTEPGFPDKMSPFYTLSGRGVDDEGEDDEHESEHSRTASTARSSSSERESESRSHDREHDD